MLVFERAAILGSGAPAPSITTRKRDGSIRATTSFTVRFWAFVLLSSAKEGVKTVIMRCSKNCNCLLEIVGLTFYVKNFDQKPHIEDPAIEPAGAAYHLGQKQFSLRVPKAVSSSRLRTPGAIPLSLGRISPGSAFKS